MITCDQCKHWKKQPPKGDWLEGTIQEGVCSKIFEGSRSEGSKAETFNHWGDDSGLKTDADFGCAHAEIECETVN